MGTGRRVSAPSSAAILGVGATFGVSILGGAIGTWLENQWNVVVFRWEMARLVVCVLGLGAFAGAIGGPVFGAAYWMLFVRRQWPSRLRAALCAGGLGALIFALLGVGFLVWESSERSYQPTKHPLLAPAAASPQRATG